MVSHFNLSQKRYVMMYDDELKIYIEKLKNMSAPELMDYAIAKPCKTPLEHRLLSLLVDMYSSLEETKNESATTEAS